MSAAPVVVARVHTGGSSADSWQASRHAMLQHECVRWLQWPEAAGVLARLLVLHCRVETGAGRHEDNFNLGNRRRFATSGGFAFERSGYLWAAYSSLREGATGYLETILGNTRRRAACLDFVSDLDAERWYRRIIATEYGGDESAVTALLALWRAETDRA